MNALRVVRLHVRHFATHNNDDELQRILGLRSKIRQHLPRFPNTDQIKNAAQQTYGVKMFGEVDQSLGYGNDAKYGSRGIGNANPTTVLEAL
jgi:hypothetical protein